MPDYRRGAEAIKTSAEAAKNRGGGGNYRPFAPSIYWKDDDEHRSKYILVLNKIEDIPVVDTISFIPVPDSPVGETVIARTDPSIGEDVDPLANDWEGQIQESNILVAVELEPVVENVNGRSRPRGFEVMTKDFNRRIRDDDGELTEETEEITAPAVGIIVQRPSNFGSVLTSFDQETAEIHRTPIKVTRQNTQPVTFQFQGFLDQEVDLTNLIDFVDGITYLNDEMDEIVEEMSKADEPLEAAGVVGSYMLNKRLDELSNNERYQEIYDGVDESLDRYGNNKKNDKKAKPKAKARPAKPSQRKVDQEEQKEKPKPTRVKEEPKNDKMAELRAKAAARKAAA